MNANQGSKGGYTGPTARHHSVLKGTTIRLASKEDGQDTKHTRSMKRAGLVMAALLLLILRPEEAEQANTSYTQSTERLICCKEQQTAWEDTEIRAKNANGNSEDGPG